MNMLLANRLCCSIDNHSILKDISLAIREGECIGLIGPNGSGKSTLLRILAGLLRPSSGQLLIAGKPLERHTRKELARIISYVPQNTAVDFDFRVRDVVLMGRFPHESFFGSTQAVDHVIAQKAMQKTGTLHLADRLVTQLSGGQRQMVLIAKALAQELELLLLDEPISALDIRYQLQVLHFMRDLAQQGVAVIAALHDLGLAARFCDRLILLHEGQLIRSGTPDEVLTSSTLRTAYGVETGIYPDPYTGSLAITATHTSEERK